MRLRLLNRLKTEQDPVKFLWSRILWKSRICQCVTMKRSGYKLKFFPTALSATLFCDPNFNQEDEEVVRKILEPGDTFVDVGANIGHLSLAAATMVGEDGQVYCFEPHPRIFHFLQRNILLNDVKNIMAYNCAIGEVKGRFMFTDSRSDDQNFIRRNGPSSMSVEVHRLDDYLFIGKTKLLKIDTEGFEKFVFLGSQQFLSQVDYIYFETHEGNCSRFGYRVTDLLEILSGFNFDFYEIIDQEFIPFSTPDASEFPNNLLAKRREADLE